MIVDFKEAFTFMFKQEMFNKKYLIGSFFMFLYALLVVFNYQNIVNGKTLFSLLALLLSLVILMIPIGYSLIYANSKIVKNEESLPEWKGNFSNILENSIKNYVGVVLFMIPSGFVLTILGIIAAIICFIISTILVGPDAVNTNPKFFYAVGGLTILFLAIVMIPILLIFMFIAFLSYCSFLTDLKILSFFNFKKMFCLMKKNFLNMFLIILLSVVITIFYNILFKVAPILYIIVFSFIGFYFMLVFNNLNAQFVQIGMKNQLAKIEEQKSEDNQEYEKL